MTFVEFAENVLGIGLFDCHRAVLEKAQKYKDNGEIYYIYPYARAGKEFLNKIIQQKLVYDRGYYQGVREFAEWLEENVFIDTESGVTVICGKEFTRVVGFLELYAEWQKGAENE